MDITKRIRILSSAHLLCGLALTCSLRAFAQEEDFGQGIRNVVLVHGPNPSKMFFKLSAKRIFDDFAQDISQREKLNLFVTQGPTGAAALAASIDRPARKNKPTWFIVAAQDRIISPRLEAMEAARMNAKTITLNTNHVAMLSDPIRVAEFIARAAATVDAR